MEAKRSILVVDGSESMTAMVQRFLQPRHVDVWTVENVVAAQTLLVQLPFDVVLTDLFLPHGAGLELLRHVRHVAPDTRVVVMVAFGTPDLQQRILAEGAYALMVKPFRLHQLWHVLQQAWHAVSPQPAPPAPTAIPAHDALHP